MRSKIAPAIVSVVLAMAVPSAQRSAADAVASASLSGTVGLNLTADLAFAATVTLIDDLGAGPNRTTLTSATGAFHFDEVPAGIYELSATKGGLVRGAYGSDKPERIGRQIVLKAGQRLENLRVPLFKGAVLAGVLQAADGQPIARASVSAVRSRYVSGARFIAQAENIGSTDDKGRYRLFGLPPGDYVVTVSRSGILTGTQLPYAIPLLSLGTFDFTSAPRIHLKTGDERTDVNIRVPVVPAGALRVHVQPADGVEISNQRPSINVLPIDMPIGLTVQMGTSVTDGVVAGLPAGEYRVSAGLSGPVGGRFQRGEVMVTVAASSEPQDVMVPLQSSAFVSGPFDVQSVTKPPRSNVGTVRVWLTNLDPNTPAVRIDALAATNRRFSLPIVPPGRYRIDARATVAGGALQLWALRSATRAGQPGGEPIIEIGSDDIDDLQLILADDLAVMSGTLSTSDGGPVPPHFIVLIATTPIAGSVRDAYYCRPATDGSFRIPGILDGTYTVSVVEDVHPFDLNNPEALDRIRTAAAMTLSFAPGEEKRQDLRISR